MSTLSVELPDELAQRLAEASRRQSVSPEEVLRRLVATLPAAAPETALNAFEVLGDTFGCFASGLGDLSTNPAHLDDLGK